MSGTEVTLIAKPHSGWTFEGWDGDLDGTELSKTVIMDKHINVSATFSGSDSSMLEIFYDNFEDNDYGNWNDGGSDCKVSTNLQKSIRNEA